MTQAVIRGKKLANGKSKYKNVATMMRKNNIAILAVQETKLDDTEADKIQTENPRLTIISNGKDTNKEGVAFIINNDLMNNRKWKHTKLIDSRASRLEIDWTEDNGIDLIVSYAPNETKEKIKYFKSLNNEIEKIKDWTETILMGDFNFIEDAIDRQPQYTDDKRIIEEFNKIKKNHKLVDGWRLMNPDTHGYTFTQDGTNSMSRIDRIYIHKDLFIQSYNWDIVTSGLLSGHDIVTVSIIKKNLPFIGKGIWCLSDDTTEYKPFRDKARKALMQMQERIEENSNKVQTDWRDTKAELKKIAIEEMKKRTNQLHNKKKSLTNKVVEDLKKLKERTITEATATKTRKEITESRQQLKELEEEQIKRMQQKAQAKYKMLGEANTKYWFRLNKKLHEKNIVMGLQDEKGRLTTETYKMVKIAT